MSSPKSKTGGYSLLLTNLITFNASSLYAMPSVLLWVIRNALNVAFIDCFLYNTVQVAFSNLALFVCFCLISSLIRVMDIKQRETQVAVMQLMIISYALSYYNI